MMFFHFYQGLRDLDGPLATQDWDSLANVFNPKQLPCLNSQYTPVLYLISIKVSNLGIIHMMWIWQFFLLVSIRYLQRSHILNIKRIIPLNTCYDKEKNNVHATMMYKCPRLSLLETLHFSCNSGIGMTGGGQVMNLGTNCKSVSLKPTE